MEHTLHYKNLISFLKTFSGNYRKKIIICKYTSVGFQRKIVLVPYLCMYACIRVRTLFWYQNSMTFLRGFGIYP